VSRRLVVVGGNGFIGVQTVRHAVAAGWEVLTVDPSPPRGRSGDTAAQHITASITDADALTAAIGDFAPEAVVNLAAYGEGTDGLASGAARHPADAVDINIGGMVTLLTALRDADCRHLIWSSSSTVYGPAPHIGPDGITEDAALHPELVYGATKVGAEHVTRVLGAQWGIRTVAVRLPLIYGSGRWYGGSQDQLVRFVEDLCSGASAHLDGWTAEADWMHVDDAAAVLLTLAATPDAAAPAYNVTGHRSSLYDMGVALVDSAGAHGRATVTATSAGAPDLPLMDTELIHRDTGFRPSITSAAEGAQRYIDDRRHHEHTD
jgi:nucleoside-diphosphate-sugar epimerase